AQSVGAEAGGALAVRGADGPARLLAAAAGHALLSGHAVGVRAARREALVRRGVAVERRADHRRAGLAPAGPVAHLDAVDGRTRAGARAAHGPRRMLPASAPPVAGSVEPAGRRARLRAHAGRPRRLSDRDRRAGPHRARDVAGAARLRAA